VPDHPDPEQLAAFQAGDGDRRQRTQVAAHVAGCPSCAEVVAEVERARARLALLGEPDLPAGLHQRLAAAVDAEAARAGRPARRPAWYRRPAAWGAAAAAILLAALVVPLLSRPDSLTSASRGDSGGGAQETQAPMAGGADTGRADTGGLPVLRLGGEVSAERLRAALASNPTARQAYRRAAAGAAAENLRGETASGQAAPSRGQTTTSGQAAPPAAAPSTTAPPPCLAAASARAGRPLVPAFLVQGNYQGRPATILVTTGAGEPARADMWVFPQGNCSGPPIASERLR
jgi:hypothetical protein